MNDLEQLTWDVRGFATEVRTLDYSSVASGQENYETALAGTAIMFRNITIGS